MKPIAALSLGWRTDLIFARFDAEVVSRHPETRHVAFGVDSDQRFDLPADFVNAGFVLDSSTTLTRERQMQRYALMVQAGLGQWFGLTAVTSHGELLVADCGLFRDAPGPGALGRFQFVSTDPAWRRRGLCGALIHAVARHGFEVMRLAPLVICADPQDAAIRIYESVGFERAVSTWQIERVPPVVIRTP